MTRIGIALVGLGPGSQPHLKSLADLQHRAELRHAVCRRPAQADLGPFAGRVAATADLDAVLADPLVQAVIVATPAGTHLDIASRCLAAGKHTLVEKPLETSLARAQALVERSRASGLRFGVVLQHRFRPGSIRLRVLLAEGALGPVQFASVRVPWWRPQAGYYDQPGRGTRERDGGGVLLTQAIHTLDLFLSLAGPVAELSAHHLNSGLRAIDTEDVATATLRFASGAIGSIDATSTAFPGYPERIELAGERGAAVLEAERLSVRLMDGTTIEAGSGGGGGGGADPMAFSHEANTRLLADFLDAIDEDRDPRTNGRSALHVHRLIDAMLRSEGRPVAP